MKTRIMFLLGLLIFALAGCNRGEVVDVQRDGNGGADVTFRLTEGDISAAISEALSAGSNPLLRNPQIDLQPGQIVVSGEHDRRDGKGSVSGTITITLSIQNGTLLAQVSQANIEGWDASDTRIAEFNQRLADNFSRRANRDNKQINFTAVTITNDAVEVVFNIKRG